MAEFNGFPRQYFTFFNQLEKNNSKEWFEKHREDYDEFVLHPAREFVIEMGKKIRKIAKALAIISCKFRTCFDLISKRIYNEY